MIKQHACMPFWHVKCNVPILYYSVLLITVDRCSDIILKCFRNEIYFEVYCDNFSSNCQRYLDEFIVIPLQLSVYLHHCEEVKVM